MTQNAINNTASTLTLGTPLTVPNGGVGATTLTDGGILLGSGTGAITATAQPASGQLLIGSVGVDPVLSTLTAGTGITITEGAGSITIDADATFGLVVQQIRTQKQDFTRYTGSFPADDSIPQNTEGSEVFTVSITPTNSSNILVIEANLTFGSIAGSSPSIVLFQDTTASAISATRTNAPGGSISHDLSLVYKMAAGTTSATTFKIRIGNSGGSTSYDVNGLNNARQFGGVLTSYIQVTEYTS